MLVEGQIGNAESILGELEKKYVGSESSISIYCQKIKALSKLCFKQLKQFQEEWEHYLQMLQVKYGSDNWQTMEYMLLKVDALIREGKVY